MMGMVAQSHTMNGDIEVQAAQAGEPAVGRQKFKFYQEPV